MLQSAAMCLEIKCIHKLDLVENHGRPHPDPLSFLFLAVSLLAATILIRINARANEQSNPISGRYSLHDSQRSVTNVVSQKEFVRRTRLVAVLSSCSEQFGSQCSLSKYGVDRRSPSNNQIPAVPGEFSCGCAVWLAPFLVFFLLRLSFI